jgi:two-component system, chemotaxis family, chemotaxis protein CheY
MSAPAAALVVDDSPAVRRHVSELLQRLGLTCDVAQDGADAWRKLAGRRYDVIVTDLHMPVMDGLKLIRLVRAAAAHRATPVLVVSAQASETDRARALALGADAYLSKPLQSPQLAGAVGALLAARRPPPVTA